MTSTVVLDLFFLDRASSELLLALPASVQFESLVVVSGSVALGWFGRQWKSWRAAAERHLVLYCYLPLRTTPPQ